jgi:hypothetical protein
MSTLGNQEKVAWVFEAKSWSRVPAGSAPSIKEPHFFLAPL